jgi:hypothetical protein
LHGKDRFKYLSKNQYYLKSPKVIITTYETLRLDIKAGYYDFINFFHLIVYDELHSIINIKKLPKRLMAISLFKANYKLALTGTPIQNYNEEIGLMNIFLNDQSSFAEIKMLSKEMKESKDKTKKERLSNILEIGLNECIKSNVVFHLKKKKKGIGRNAKILSLPIDDRMNQYIESSGNRFTHMQRKYLSHPASVLKTEDKEALPRCTKAEAIRYILESTLPNEKVIIFSSYIDVLDAYINYCFGLGYESIKITGKDKGRKLERKLLSFRDSDTVKILFTTLQKSAEGLNLDIATHVIILEFWWNPQKLFQAMSRVDRLTQERNIFMYLLCYNYYGEIINIEDAYFNKIVDKVNNANSIYLDIDKFRIEYIGGMKSEYYELPEIISFSNIDTLADELSKFLNSFLHTPYEPPMIIDNFGTSIDIVRNKLVDETNKYLQYNNILSHCPWLITSFDARYFFFHYYSKKLDGQIRKRILPIHIEIPSLAYTEPALDEYYPIIYTRNITYQFHLITGNIGLPVRYVLGKRIDGKYDILVVDFETRQSIPSLLGDLKSKGINDMSLIIKGHDIMAINRDKLKILKNYPNTKIELCISALVERVFRDSDCSSEDISNANNILRQKSISEAYELCRNPPISKEPKNSIYQKLSRHLHYISGLFSYTPDTRAKIGTTNLISYIGFHTQFLLENECFANELLALSFLKIVSRKILDNGKKLIPTWGKLIQPVEI